MYELITLLFDICCFKKAPQDLPYSRALLQLLIVINALTGFLILKIHTDWLSAVLQSLFGVVMLVAFNRLALFIAKKPARFYQSTSALLGSDTLIGIFALPCLATLQTGHGSLLAFGVLLSLVVWHWAIIGHILRHALEQSLAFSLGLAFLYLVGAYTLTALLFPDVAGV